MYTVKPGYCPVCGYNLGYSPWEGDSSSDEICPCCYIQFGYDDWVEDGPSARENIYENWRKCWIDGGMKWHSKGINPPVGWNPVDQIRTIGICLGPNGQPISEPLK